MERAEFSKRFADSEDAGVRLLQGSEGSRADQKFALNTVDGTRYCREPESIIPLKELYVIAANCELSPSGTPLEVEGRDPH